MIDEQENIPETDDILTDPDLENSLNQETIQEDFFENEKNEASDESDKNEETSPDSDEWINESSEEPKEFVNTLSESSENADEQDSKDLSELMKDDTSAALFFNRNKLLVVILIIFAAFILFFAVVYPELSKKKEQKKDAKIENRGETYIPDFPEFPVVEEVQEEKEPEKPEPKKQKMKEEDLEKKFPSPYREEHKQTSQRSTIPETNRNEQQKQPVRMTISDGVISNLTGNSTRTAGSQNSSKGPTYYTPGSSAQNGYTPASLQSGLDAIRNMNSAGAQSSYTLQNDQSGKEKFLNKFSGTSSMQWNSIVSLWKGTIISAVLDTSINTDLPGQVMAHVNKNVYSSQDGKYLLIPQGSRLYGEYNSNISYGQSQVQVVWNTLIRTDGLEINLGSMNGIDAYGVSGYKGFKTEHPFEYVKAMGLIAMFSIIDTGVNRSIDTANNTYAQNVMADVYSSGKKLGDKIVDRAMDIQPTIKIKSGTEVALITNLTIDIPPMENIPVTEKYVRERK